MRQDKKQDSTHLKKYLIFFIDNVKRIFELASQIDLYFMLNLGSLTEKRNSRFALSDLKY